MKKNIKRILIFLIVIILIASAIMLVRHRKSELADLAPPPIRSIPVYIKVAESGELALTEHYLGSIVPVVKAVISAQATGYLMSIEKDVGDWLQAGETVAVIDDRLLKHQTYALEAELAGAREDVDLKKIIKERRKELVKHRATAIENFDEANLAYELAVSRVRKLEQELEAAKVNLTFTGIQSILNGIVTDRMKDPGDMVMPGTPVFTIEDPKQGYKVLVRVPQETILLLSDNSPVCLTHGDKVIQTTIYRVHPAISTGNLATVEIRLPERPFGLPSYGTVGVDLITGMPEGIVVSSDCILEQETGALVYVVQDNQIVRPVSVNLLGVNSGQAVIEGPVKSGTRLAAGPESMLLQLSKNGRIVPISGGEK